MKRPTLQPASQTLISLGGAIVVVVCILTVQDLGDRAFFRVFLPGMLMALPLLIAGLIWQYMRGPHRKRRHRSVLKSHRL